MARLQLVTANKEARAPRVRNSHKPVAIVPQPVVEAKDHFVTRNGLTYAGSHLIIDLWEAEGLDDRDRIEQALIDAVKASGATLLHIHLHRFTEGGVGVQARVQSRPLRHRRTPARRALGGNRRTNTRAEVAMAAPALCLLG